MNLHQTTRPTTCTVSSVKLQKSTNTVVGAYRLFNSVILLRACLAEFLPDFKHTPNLGCIIITGKHFRHCILTQPRYFFSCFRFKPSGKLCNTVRIAKPGYLYSLLHKCVTHGRSEFKRTVYHIHINRNTSAVYYQIRFPFFLNKIGNFDSG